MNAPLRGPLIFMAEGSLCKALIIACDRARIGRNPSTGTRGSPHRPATQGSLPDVGQRSSATLRAGQTVKPSRKLHTFESSTRHQVQDEAPGQRERRSGASSVCLTGSGFDPLDLADRVGYVWRSGGVLAGLLPGAAGALSAAMAMRSQRNATDGQLGERLGSRLAVVTGARRPARLLAIHE
jgi:hypothetical protein